MPRSLAEVGVGAGLQRDGDRRGALGDEAARAQHRARGVRRDEPEVIDRAGGQARAELKAGRSGIDGQRCAAIIREL